MESSPIFTAVEPVRPAAPYLGGKRNLAKRLVALIETIPHTVYAEPFVGMGGVFFRRRLRPKVEVINDWSRDVWTFFRMLQDHHNAFMDLIRFHISSRAEFDRLKSLDPANLTDLQRAARFLYLQRLAFGGKITGRNYGVSLDRPARFDVSRLAGDLADIHDRLAGVEIECQPWAEFVARRDTPGTLFYLDPPYWACEDDYGEGMFSRADFEALAAVLKGLKGRFVMSLNDVPGVRETFKDFHIEGVGTHYGVAGGGASPAREVIITPA
ncbi:DNA adenine methylase [Caulobacter segnis]|uniref:site-specific DNA-methyltransferase (adenine-specific) n=1 Tax=Caulobacter segnis TaxID=88688 RepID=A0A2W5WBK2_9CAUL|nr:DNA adenine methylase [Caulobacter segnis]PZR30938.1 MAG: DNA methyltransferase [Caulobacter segnis]